MSDIKIESIAKLELGPGDVLLVRLSDESVSLVPPNSREKYFKRIKEAVQRALDQSGLRNSMLLVVGESTHFSRLVGISQPATRTTNTEESI